MVGVGDDRDVQTVGLRGLGDQLQMRQAGSRPVEHRCARVFDLLDKWRPVGFACGVVLELGVGEAPAVLRRNGQDLVARFLSSREVANQGGHVLHRIREQRGHLCEETSRHFVRRVWHTDKDVFAMSERAADRIGRHGRYAALQPHLFLVRVKRPTLADQEEVLLIAHALHCSDNVEDAGVEVVERDLATVDAAKLVALLDQGPHCISELVRQAWRADVARVVATGNADCVFGDTGLVTRVGVGAIALGARPRRIAEHRHVGCWRTAVGRWLR